MNKKAILSNKVSKIFIIQGGINPTTPRDCLMRMGGGIPPPPPPDFRNTPPPPLDSPLSLQRVQTSQKSHYKKK